MRELSKYARIVITSEDPLPRDLEKYRSNIPPERMHDALYYASLYAGEGATMDRNIRFLHASIKIMCK